MILQTFALRPACPLPPLENWGFDVAFTSPAGFEGIESLEAVFSACIDLEGKLPTDIPSRDRGTSQHSQWGSDDKGSGVQVAEEALENGQQSAGKSDFVKVLPAATEEEWQRRVHKRQEAIQKMKLSPIYYENQHVHASKRPHTPDVFSRNVSKRDWEGAVAKWRYAWRELDGVSALMHSTGSCETDSLAAWNKAASCIKKETDSLAAWKKLHGEQRKLHPDHTYSQEQAQLQHKQQALAILCAERRKHPTHFI